MIKIDSLSFSYGEKEVIKNFSLNINSGDRICLFGESGCGKTTLLRMLSGLEVPESGKIEGLSSLKPSIVFQEDRLLPFKTVLQNITLVRADTETAMLHLNALGLSGSAQLYPTELSGGMRQRAAIARALSAEYDFLILDEPFTGLDRENVVNTVAHISASLKDRTLIMVSHQAEEAELLGAEIIAINKS